MKEHETEILRWEDPHELPEERTRSEHLLAELQERPEEWALIQEEGALTPSLWWAPMITNEDVEVKVVNTKRTPFSPRKIYTRYIGR